MLFQDIMLTKEDLLICDKPPDIRNVQLEHKKIVKSLEIKDKSGTIIDSISYELGCSKLNLSDDLIQNALNPVENVKIRSVPGGPAPAMVAKACDNIKEFLNMEFEKKGIQGCNY